MWIRQDYKQNSTLNRNGHKHIPHFPHGHATLMFTPPLQPDRTTASTHIRTHQLVPAGKKITKIKLTADVLENNAWYLYVPRSNNDIYICLPL